MIQICIVLFSSQILDPKLPWILMSYIVSYNFLQKNKNFNWYEDFIFNCEDLKVYIDPKSFTYLRGTKVDFVSEGVNEEVKFLNPNVKAVCGCGETFEIDW